MAADYQERCDKSIELLFEYGACDGGQHKMLAIDQAIRILADDGYEERVQEYEELDEDGEKVYEWYTGVAP